MPCSQVSGVTMPLLLSDSQSNRQLRRGALWPVHEDVNASPPEHHTPAVPIQSAVHENQSSHSLPVLQCCKDEDNRNGVCCRELRPSDQRTLLSPDVIRDIIIGLSDGLTVPFALTAGLSSLGSSRFVVLAGVAELISGAISMGVGGFLSTQSEAQHYHFRAAEVNQRVSRSCPKELTDEIADILEPYGAPYSIASSLSAHLWATEQLHRPQSPSRSLFNSLTQRSRLEENLAQDERAGMTHFLIRVGAGLEPIPRSRIYTSAVTIGFSYLIGGLVPLLPYIIINSVRTALFVSIGVTAALLLVFGTVKQYYSGAQGGIRGYSYGAISTLFVGGMAAAVSWGIVRAIEAHQPPLS